MAIEIISVSPEEFADMDIRDQLARIFYAVYTIAPFFDTEAQVAVSLIGIERYAERPGFRCYLARDIEHDATVGFAFGHALLPGNSWWDNVPPAMTEAARERWLRDCWVLVEFAVLPQWQGYGIGGKLHDAALAGLSQATAILSTPQMDTNALALYRKRGWVTLLTDFSFPDVFTPFLILGKDLA
jgi:GNAT superfamily N-acetyltransferase